MKIIILQEKLKEGLLLVERIVSKSLSLPVLNNTLITTEKNFLKLSATDLELGINFWLLTKIEKEGQAVVPVKTLCSFINLISNKQVFLESSGLDLLVKYNNHQTQIKGVSPEDFPIIPVLSDEKTLLVNSADFCQGLDQVINFTTPSPTRPEISGVYISFQKEQIIMAATDSFRLGEKKIAFENRNKKTADFLGKESSFILPSRAAKEIINIFGDREGYIKIYFSQNQTMFEVQMEETEHPKIQLVSRLIDGNYPNYQEIIPKKFNTIIVLQRAEFLNQIKLASLFSNRSNEIKLKIEAKEKKMEISSQNPEVGNYSSVLTPTQIKGDSVEISFNHRFLAEGILNIKSPEIIFELNGDEGPGVLKPADEQNYIYLIMPVKSS